MTKFRKFLFLDSYPAAFLGALGAVAIAVSEALGHDGIHGWQDVLRIATPIIVGALIHTQVSPTGAATK